LRHRVPARAALAAVLLVLCSATIAQANPFQTTLRAYTQRGLVPACEFSSAELEAAIAGTPPDIAQYTSYPDAVQAALQARAAGSCRAHHSQTTPHLTTTHASHSSGSGSGSGPLSPVITLVDSGVPAPVALLMVLAAALAVALVAFRIAAARSRRLATWLPASAPASRHPPGGAGSRSTMTSGYEHRSRQRRGQARLTLVVALALVALVVGLLIGLSSGSPRPYNKAQQSIFQDDDHLLYASTPTVEHTLAMLQRLGVQRVRLTIKWSAIAPETTAIAPPPHFNAADPGDYPTGAWAPYDRIVRLARRHRIAVDFNVTGPGPEWALRPSPYAPVADVYEPSATDFGQFVAAVGVRYSGRYRPDGGAPLPRVSYWSIWNEPNQPAWLAPQWTPVDGEPLPVSAKLYRALVDAATIALAYGGHTVKTDTILIGETAPTGSGEQTLHSAMTPMQFVRALYCVNSADQPLQGTAATLLGCPQDPGSFRRENPILFDATGFAHHPYDLLHGPSYLPSNPNVVTMSTLSRLSGALDRIFATYGVDRRLPLYLTEFGYETNPPDPYQVISPAEQAAYLDQADYMAWRDPRVRALSQFLLYDAAPNAVYPPSSYEYWDTFQSGLLYANGDPKPALAAYRLPIWMPQSICAGSCSLLVWGQLRLAPHGTPQQARIEWQGTPGTGWRMLSAVRVTNADGYFETHVTVPGSGRVRITWHSPGGKVIASRSVVVDSG
jgi:hypothetical protein